MTTVYDGSTDHIPTKSPGSGSFGSEVEPMGPLQDMESSIDIIAGSVHDRTDSVSVFTGGDSERGLGGQAEPPAPMKRDTP